MSIPRLVIANTFDLHWQDPFVLDGGVRCRRPRIVAIMTDEEAVIVIVDPLERRLEHRGDDCCLVPGRNEDGDEPWILPEDVMAGLASLVPSVDGRSAPDAPREVDEIDQKVVEAEQQESHAGEQRQLSRRTAENLCNGHASGAGTNGPRTML